MSFHSIIDRITSVGYERHYEALLLCIDPLFAVLDVAGDGCFVPVVDAFLQ